MTTYYCGIGGDDGATGLSWALRKLTLNGAENIPVAGDDIVYVGPGTYRELLTCDVSGTSGHLITYIGDVDGSHTDGVGGIVRITGSDDDIVYSRNNCINISERNYRTFQGFTFDLSRYYHVYITNGTNATFTDCYFGLSIVDGTGLEIEGTATSLTVKRCIFNGIHFIGLFIEHTSDVDNTGHLIEDCLFIGNRYCSLGIKNHGGITIRNCSFYYSATHILCTASPAAGQVNTVNNCIIVGGAYGFSAIATTDITENYNSVFSITSPYTNVTPGANSNAYPQLLNPPILLAGYKYPWNFPELAPYSPVRAIAGTGEATDDLYGRARPATSEKKSWGAVQYTDSLRDTTTKQTGTASMKISNAGRHQIWVPTTNVETVFTVSCYRESDYTGTASQMVIKQPGQADTTVTDADATNEEWHALTSTLTPAASPGYCVVELVSNNTKIYTHQVETQTVVVTDVAAGNARCVVTAAGMPGSPVTVTFAVGEDDADTVVATKARAALVANANVGAFFMVSGAGADIVITARQGAANDTTMNITIEDVSSSGITDDTSSVDTTPGAVFSVATYFDDLTVT